MDVLVFDGRLDGSPPKGPFLTLEVYQKYALTELVSRLVVVTRSQYNGCRFREKFCPKLRQSPSWSRLNTMWVFCSKLSRMCLAD